MCGRSADTLSSIRKARVRRCGSSSACRGRTDTLARVPRRCETAGTLTTSTPNQLLIGNPVTTTGRRLTTDAAVPHLVGHMIGEVARELVLHTLIRYYGSRTQSASILGISIRCVREQDSRIRKSVNFGSQIRRASARLLNTNRTKFYGANLTPAVAPRLHTSSQFLAGTRSKENASRNSFGSGIWSDTDRVAPFIETLTTMQWREPASVRTQAS